MPSPSTDGNGERLSDGYPASGGPADSLVEALYAQDRRERETPACGCDPMGEGIRPQDHHEWCPHFTRLGAP